MAHMGTAEIPLIGSRLVSQWSLVASVGYGHIMWCVVVLTRPIHGAI